MSFVLISTCMIIFTNYLLQADNTTLEVPPLKILAVSFAAQNTAEIKDQFNKITNRLKKSRTTPDILVLSFNTTKTGEFSADLDSILQSQYGHISQAHVLVGKMYGTHVALLVFLKSAIGDSKIKFEESPALNAVLNNKIAELSSTLKYHMSNANIQDLLETQIITIDINGYYLIRIVGVYLDALHLELEDINSIFDKIVTDIFINRTRANLTLFPGLFKLMPFIASQEKSEKFEKSSTRSDSDETKPVSPSYPDTLEQDSSVTPKAESASRKFLEKLSTFLGAQTQLNPGTLNEQVYEEGDYLNCLTKDPYSGLSEEPIKFAPPFYTRNSNQNFIVRADNYPNYFLRIPYYLKYSHLNLPLEGLVYTAAHSDEAEELVGPGTEKEVRAAVSLEMGVDLKKFKASQKFIEALRKYEKIKFTATLSQKIVEKLKESNSNKIRVLLLVGFLGEGKAWCFCDKAIDTPDSASNLVVILDTPELLSNFLSNYSDRDSVFKVRMTLSDGSENGVGNEEVIYKARGIIPSDFDIQENGEVKVKKKMVGTFIEESENSKKEKYALKANEIGLFRIEVGEE